MRLSRLAILAVVVMWLLAATAVAQGAMTVLVGDVKGPHAQDVEIPIEVKGASGVGAMHIEMAYDPAVLSVKEVQAGDLASGGMVVGNTTASGLVTISVAHASGFSGDGVVAKVVARVSGKGGATSPLNLQNVTANHFQTKAVIPTIVTNGTFTEGGSAAGTAGIWVFAGLIALVVFGAGMYAFTRKTTAGRAAAPGTAGTLGLSVVEGAASQSFMPLDQPVTTIGRSSGNRLVVDDEQVSRQHARIVSSGNVHTVYDLGSANGVSVNGQRVTQQELKVGDRITLGATTLMVRQI